MGTWIYNGGHQPLVLEWGHGVIMPGEGIEVDNPESYGPPWTTDPETDPKPPESPVTPPPDNPSGEATAGGSGAENASGGPSLEVRPDGEIVNQAGQVVGHIDNGGNA